MNRCSNAGKETVPFRFAFLVCEMWITVLTWWSYKD